MRDTAVILGYGSRIEPSPTVAVGADVAGGRVGIEVLEGVNVAVYVAVYVAVQAACVLAIAVWIACADGAQAASKIVAKHMIMVRHLLFILSLSVNVNFLIIIIAQFLTLCSCNLTVDGNVKLT
jgi:hypothetical protein